MNGKSVEVMLGIRTWDWKVQTISLSYHGPIMFHLIGP